MITTVYGELLNTSTDCARPLVGAFYIDVPHRRCRNCIDDTRPERPKVNSPTSLQLPVGGVYGEYSMGPINSRISWFSESVIDTHPSNGPEPLTDSVCDVHTVVSASKLSVSQ